MQVESLTIPLDAFDAGKALEAWRWLLPDRYQPFAISLFGDWLVEAPDGSVHLMDTLEGRLTGLAASRTGFAETVESNEDCRDEWLLEGLVLGQASRGIVLKAGHCFGFEVPPILGAPIAPENILPCEIVSYEVFVGALHERLRTMPPGTDISKLTTDGREP